MKKMTQTTDYQEAVDYLFSQTPQFCQIGAAAYKPGLDTVKQLSESFGNPHKSLRTIHIAGTNGKGSTAHSIAAVLAKAGYKVGLYTSPHLLDFRERIRVNGQMVSQQYVSDFVQEFRQKEMHGFEPSFFELTTVMAFKYFVDQSVDIAVIETGLGGRLDSTNIITPELSVITNISMDHMAQLGNTLETIAGEKAGIIKEGIPVIIGEKQEETASVFEARARQMDAPLRYADDYFTQLPEIISNPQGLTLSDPTFGDIAFELSGNCQRRNILTILAALKQLRNQGWEIPHKAVKEGLANVCELTGLMGRWMTISKDPHVICDTGHNPGGWEYLSRQLNDIIDQKEELTMIIGFVNDKDLSHILPLMPKRARYVFTNASIPRALPAKELEKEAAKYGLHGLAISGVAQAMMIARQIVGYGNKRPTTFFVGGSTFVVADFLKSQNFRNFATEQ